MASLFGERLKAARNAVGLTQHQLAQRAGVTTGAVSRWESGADVPSFERLPALRASLRVSLDELICGMSPSEGHQVRSAVEYFAEDVEMEHLIWRLVALAPELGKRRLIGLLDALNPRA